MNDRFQDSDLSLLLEGVTGTPRALARGELLFREGEPGDSFYLVQGGRFRAIRNLGSREKAPLIVGEIGRGELVGEMAVLGYSLRSASVVAMRDSHVIEVSGSDLENLPRSSLLQVLRVLAQRIRHMLDRDQRQSLPSCVAILPISKDVPIDEYASRLRDSLADTDTPCSLFGSRDLPARFDGLESADDSRFRLLGSWLDEREVAGETLLLQADWSLTPWTQRCLCQADLILLVATAGSDPGKSPAEEAIDRLPKEARPRVDLVLLQKELPYRGTARWLEHRQICRHYHVRLHSPVDKARAGRLLTGRDVSLALGGGGARGFAHIGILRACDELDIPVDRVCGTSMGAVVGGVAALGLDWREIADRIRSHFPPERKLIQYTLPVLSIDTAKRYIRTLESMYGDTQIEDLPVNYFCVSCNLTRANILVHRRGPLAKWVGASMSVPGIAPPLVENGELIVDGGLLNNLPVDLAKADGAGMVVGIDVSPQTEFSLPSYYSGRPQAFQVLRSWLPRRARPGKARPVFPSLPALLHRSTTLGSVFNQEKLKQEADCYIKVPVDGFKLLEFERLDDIAEIGYRTGMNELRPVATWANPAPPVQPETTVV